MREALYTIFLFLGIYAILFTVDVLTTPSVSDAEIAQANAYLRTEKLPTPPIPFYEDGCTAWPDYLLWHDFYEACLQHDIAYWAGGELERKAAADLALYENVSHTGPLGPVFATIMYYGVHFGGNNFISYQLGSNWGYGWNTD